MFKCAKMSKNCHKRDILGHFWLKIGCLTPRGDHIGRYHLGCLTFFKVILVIFGKHFGLGGFFMFKCAKMRENCQNVIFGAIFDKNVGV
jgi:hypothetical protein